MTIPNRAVLSLVAIFALAGLFVLPPTEYGLRWLHLAGILLLGMTANALGLLGAGDAKFLAATAPFVPRTEIAGYAVLLALCILIAFALHRALRAVPAVRRRTPGWTSWERRRDFPLGLALGPALALHLALSI